MFEAGFWSRVDGDKVFFVLALVLLFYAGSLYLPSRGGSDFVFGVVEDEVGEGVPAGVAPGVLNRSEKAFLARSGMKAFRLLAANQSFDGFFLDGGVRDVLYEDLFVTLGFGGGVEFMGRGRPRGGGGRHVAEDLAYAVGDAVDSPGFKGFSGRDLEYVVVELLHNPRQVRYTGWDAFGKKFSPGLHGLRLKKGVRSDLLPGSWAVSNNKDARVFLGELCGRLGLDDGCYDSRDVELELYDTVSFVLLGERLFDLYRHNIPVPVGDVSNESVYWSVQSGFDWYLRNVDNASGLFNYGYYPNSDRYFRNDNSIRQLSSAWILSEASAYLNDSRNNRYIVNTLDKYLELVVEDDGFMYLRDGNRARIGVNGFVVMTLLELEDYPGRAGLINNLSEGILSLQNPDGSFRTDFVAEVNPGWDYYPGLSMLALMRLYRETGDARLLDSVERGFDFYSGFWLVNRTAAMTYSLTLAFEPLYRETGREDVADLILRMNNWSVSRGQRIKAKYFDESGCYRRDKTILTSQYLSGLPLAYRLALEKGDEELADRFGESIVYGARCVLQHQYSRENGFYLDNPDRALGGFRHSLLQNSERMDYTQNSIMFFLNILESGFFAV